MSDTRTRLKALLDSIPDDDELKATKRAIWDMFKEVKKPETIVQMQKVEDKEKDEEIKTLRAARTQLEEQVRWLRSQLAEAKQSEPEPDRYVIHELECPTDDDFLDLREFVIAMKDLTARYVVKRSTEPYYQQALDKMAILLFMFAVTQVDLKNPGVSDDEIHRLAKIRWRRLAKVINQK